MTGETNRILKTYLLTAWPVVLEQVLISMITAIDTMMVGDLGIAAISAVGLTNQPRQIMMLPITALNIGVMTMIGRLKGAKRQDMAVHCLKRVLLISTLVSVAVCSLALVFMTPILEFSGAQPDSLGLAEIYFRYVTIGTIFHCIGLTFTAAQRGIGKTRISLICNLSANLVNIFLNYCLISGNLGFQALGIKGAAIATMISGIVSLVVAVVPVCMPSNFLYLLRSTSTSIVEQMSIIFELAKNTFVERLGHRVGLMLFFKIVAELGTVEFATYSIGTRFTNLAFSIGDGLGVAAGALVAQSMGAADNERAARFAKVGLITALTISTTYMLCGLGIFPQLIMLFTDDAGVLALGKIAMPAIAIAGLMHIPQCLLLGSLRGAGDTRYLARVTLISTMLYRPISAAILCLGFDMGLLGVYISLVSENAMRLLFTVRRYCSSNWLERNRLGV